MQMMNILRDRFNQKPIVLFYLHNRSKEKFNINKEYQSILVVASL